MDLFLYDVKLASNDAHVRATGSGNERVLENLARLTSHGARVWVRVPVIPGYHDEAELRRIADELAGFGGIERVDLLPYHRYGIRKYGQLGREYPLSGTAASPAIAREHADIFTWRRN